MLVMRNQLPPLDLLIAFEAAGRLGSFQLAAQELALTPPAISQQIAKLEQSLGRGLFTRSHRRVQLTPAGQQFQASVTFALEHLAGATARTRQTDGGQTLRVAADTSMAALWLPARLAAFSKTHPEVRVRLLVSDRVQDLVNDQTQIALVHGRSTWRGFHSQLLFQETVFPVCSPDYSAPTDLTQADLLDLDYEHWHWMNWAIWFSELGLPNPQTPRTLRSNAYLTLIDAAKAGQGVALGWASLVDADMAAGRLIRPSEFEVSTTYGYHLLWPNHGELSAEQQLFVDFLT